MAEITLNDIRKFFEIPIKDFRTMWAALTADDKAQIRAGFENGTMTY